MRINLPYKQLNIYEFYMSFLENSFYDLTPTGMSNLLMWKVAYLNTVTATISRKLV